MALAGCQVATDHAISGPSSPLPTGTRTSADSVSESSRSASSTNDSYEGASARYSGYPALVSKATNLNSEV